MLILLVVMVVPYCWADEVCFNFTNYDIKITIHSAIVTEKSPGFVKCYNNGAECILLCQFAHNTSSWFNGSFDCKEATTFSSGHRMEINMTNLDINCDLFPCVNTTVADIIDSLSEDMDELMKLYYIRSSCPFLFCPESPYRDLRKSYIQKELGMIHHVMESSTSSFASHDLKDVGINVIKITTENLDTKDCIINVPAAQLLPQMDSHIPEILFPSYALRKIPEEKRVLGTVSYMSPNQFEFEPVNISSMVIRIELLGMRRLDHLNPPIEMVFRNVVQTFDENYTLACHYFDEKALEWQTDGCETTINLTDNIICSCNHMTAFAVLLIKVSIDPIHWQILSIISYIGCGLSAFFTALSIVMFLFSPKKADHSVRIHVSLSGALFLLNVTFLLTEWGARVKPDWICVFVAAAMHYALLCSFTWMALEAVHLYLLLIKVFNTNYKNYMLKLSVAGWGIPAVIVSVSVAVKENDFYGLTETIMADSNQTSAICWITDDSYFYSVNLVYFTVIFMFNSGILTAVASTICKTKQVFRNVKVRREEKSKWRDSARFAESCKSSLTVLGLTCLMGTTWGLAFLGSGYVNYPVLYLFCIFNSTQGLFIFIWICLSTNKQRKRERENKMTSTLAKTSTTKTE